MILLLVLCSNNVSLKVIYILSLSATEVDNLIEVSIVHICEVYPEIRIIHQTHQSLFLKQRVC